jgi:hypothetical protein
LDALTTISSPTSIPFFLRPLKDVGPHRFIQPIGGHRRLVSFAVKSFSQ